MAEKARTAHKGADTRSKRLCPVCGSESKVVQFAGFGQKGFFWVCEDKKCQHAVRTR